jgi:hypothetical protein
MSSQSQVQDFECVEENVTIHNVRQKRLGSLRTDMHTEYDVPFLAGLDGLSTGELRKIVSSREYSSEIRVEAKEIIHEREDPQDRDNVETEM